MGNGGMRFCRLQRSERSGEPRAEGGTGPSVGKAVRGQLRRQAGETEKPEGKGGGKASHSESKA